MSCTQQIIKIRRSNQIMAYVRRQHRTADYVSDNRFWSTQSNLKSRITDYRHCHTTYVVTKKHRTFMSRHGNLSGSLLLSQMSGHKICKFYKSSFDVLCNSPVWHLSLSAHKAKTYFKLLHFISTPKNKI